MHCVAGSSAGSLVGAIFCAGYGPEAIKANTMRLSWWQLARLTWPRQGFFSFEPLERWLVRLIGDRQFSDLKIPFAAVATDLERGVPVWLRQGRLARAVRASCSVPGIITPVEIDGMILGDGSLADTVPVDILRQMGADYVIGVDIFSTYIRRGWGPFGMGLNALEILVERAGGGIDRADCLIAPDLHGATYLRFSRREQMFELGEKAAWEMLPTIQRNLSELAAARNGQAGLG